MPHIKCSKCHGAISVMRTTHAHAYTARVRLCKGCGHTYVTHEVALPISPFDAKGNFKGQMMPPQVDALSVATTPIDTTHHAIHDGVTQAVNHQAAETQHNAHSRAYYDPVLDARLEAMLASHPDKPHDH